MKTYELKIEDDTDEVFAISLVENPAIEENWMYFKKENQLFQKVDTDKRMIVGPILIPNKKILRVDGEGDPYQVFFSTETVKELAQNYLKKKYTSNSTLEHEKYVKGVYLVESWIKEGKLDKSNTFGLNLPEGTWVGVFKIEDDEIWNNYVKTGKVQGFSIEGLFSHELVHTSNLSVQREMGVESIEEEKSSMVLNEIRALILEEIRLNNPKVTSTYPGEVATGSFVSPTLLENIRLPKDQTIILQADDDSYNRGLNVTYKSDGGYDINYWMNDPSKVYPAKVVVNDTTEIKDAVNIHIGYHEELK